MRTRLFLLAPELVLRAPSAPPNQLPLDLELSALALAAADLRSQQLQMLAAEQVLGEVPLVAAAVTAPLPVLLMKAAFLMALTASTAQTRF